MIRLVTLLTLTALLWSFFAFKNNSLPLNSTQPPAVTAVVPLTPTSILGLATDSAGLSDWKIYTDENQNYEFRYPSTVQIKTLTDGTLSLSDDTLAISVSARPLPGTETVNTLAEKDINHQQEKMGVEFKLLDTISPISIGFQTGVTYTTEESGREVTYFYIPLSKTFLKIVNRTTEVPGQKLISLSDDIIYSLKILNGGL